MGWGIFIALIVALEAGHYIFNPFVFGFAYYAVYVLSRIAVQEEMANSDLLSRRVILLALVVLLNLWTVVDNESNKHRFLRQFDKICARYAEDASANQVCEEIRSDIGDSLDREPDFGEE